MDDPLRYKEWQDSVKLGENYYGPSEARNDAAEDLENLGMSILSRAGAVRCCECHDYPISQMDDDAVRRAYAIGNSMISKGEIVEDRKELAAAIKRAYDNAFWECPGCVSNARDD